MLTREGFEIWRVNSRRARDFTSWTHAGILPCMIARGCVQTHLQPFEGSTVGTMTLQWLCPFHGIFSRSSAMGQKSVTPAKIRPRPTNADRKIHLGLIVRARITPKNTTKPAASRTCRSRDQRVFRLETTGRPD